MSSSIRPCLKTGPWLRRILRSESGSSLAEMAILASIYAALVTAAIYLGHIGMMKIDAQRTVGYAAAQAGEQVQTDVEDLLPSAPVTITDFNDSIDDEEMWDAYDFFSVLEDMARAPVGHYIFSDGEIIYVLDEDRLSAFGQYIFDNDLQNESDNVAEVLSGWVYRTESTISCRYDPVFGKWDPVNLTGVSSSSHVMGDKERGTHLPDEPGFNTEVFEMLSGEQFPDPIDPEPDIWSSQ